MFDWLFGSPCPLDPAAKNWVETRLAWLQDEFGEDELLTNPIILPTPTYFPDPYDGSRRAARVLFDRVCGYAGIDPAALRLEFIAPRPYDNPLYLVNGTGEALPTAAAGLYGGQVICLSEDELPYPMALVGTMAHELSHHLLLGANRIDPEVYDHELLTDLTTVFKGLGIFLANSPRHWDGNHTLWPGTELRKPEYMTGAMFGYALAVVAWVRGDDKARWAQYLAPGVRGEFWQGVRYLRTTGDCLLQPPSRPA
ncbi:Uncharacterized protein OS=Planctomyces limnophilus (strain ATCC 43296 / DSM 3776 / IFAM 1008 / 290) GN=Plim_2537 PE=4 SV=1 [Gemmataceae bacterium]|nr:Uncharacterized protein OS=Planctomyces limnophilus (strain ATCC 43296 / DSM 3776 / IFAM 1008 / 290) GN=Plim_2537 PE=4 SV=1 [Gemmataceae bacterium]VTT99312.1 Uncharacterized protein OS=Planctomyces limnophilus (strain ATCC 43296 / DSM 3776 / IFAM 1008 / 290) GN=Plim_2537 PE=4 SV=1 [Gemmataceae bacterium]